MSPLCTPLAIVRRVVAGAERVDAHPGAWVRLIGEGRPPRSGGLTNTSYRFAVPSGTTVRSTSHQPGSCGRVAGQLHVDRDRVQTAFGDSPTASIARLGVALRVSNLKV